MKMELFCGLMCLTLWAVHLRTGSIMGLVLAAFWLIMLTLFTFGKA